jgi:hypothetical protein
MITRAGKFSRPAKDPGFAFTLIGHLGVIAILAIPTALLLTALFKVANGEALFRLV